MFTIEWSKKLNNYISYFPLGSLILLFYFLYSISFYLNLRIILKFRNSFSKDWEYLKRCIMSVASHENNRKPKMKLAIVIPKAIVAWWSKKSIINEKPNG